MRKSYILLVLSLCVPYFISAQKQGQSRVDSLLDVLKTTPQDTNRVLILDNLSFEYYNIDPALGIRYGNMVLSLSKELEWTRGLAKGYSDLGINYEAQSDHEKALRYYDLSLKLYQQLGDKNSVAGVIANIGAIYIAQSDYPEALERLFNALSIYESLGDKKNIAKIKSNIGNVFLAQKDYGKALVYYGDALDLAYGINDRKGIARLLANIGIVYDARGNFEQALANHFKAYEINKELGVNYAIQINLANIGYVYSHMAKFPEALKYQLMALDISNRMGDRTSTAINLGNIGETYYSMAESEAANGTNRPDYLAAATRYLEQAVATCREINFAGPQTEFSQYLSNAYMKTGNFKKAFEYLKEYVRLNDSVFSVEKQVEIAALQAGREMELRNKDLQIKEKQLEIERLGKEKRQYERVVYITSIALLLFLIGVALRYLYAYRSSNRKLSADNLGNLQLLTEAQQLARVGNWNVDLRKDKIYWSEVMRTIFGVDEDFEPGYQAFVSLIHLDDRKDVMAKITAAQQTGGTFEYTLRVVKPDGEIRVLNTKNNCVLDSKGKPVRLYGTVHDITELKQAEDTLRRSEVNIKTIFNNTDVVYVLLDTDLRLVSFNQLAIEFAAVELHAQLAEGDDMISKFPEERQAAVSAAFQKTLAGNTVAYEVWYEQSAVWYDAKYFPVFDEHNKVQGIVMAAVNITTRKESEKQTLDLVERLQKQNRDLNQFAYIVSHNLRAPIAKILGLSALFDDEPEGDEHAQLVQFIRDEVAGLDQVITDINTIITTRDADHVTREKVCVDATLKLILQVLEPQIRSSNANITTDLAVNGLMSVKGYIYSIIYNLISNAIKYRMPDTPLHIHLATSYVDRFVCLKVADNGSGMDLQKNKDKLFGLYKRFHDKNIDGRGMGLYLVKTQVEALGGRIEVESTVHKGCTFYIYLPANT